MALIRIDKYVSEQFALTRSESRKKIRGGYVTANGEVLSDPSLKIDSETPLTLDGKTVLYEENVYLMLNKPKGVVTATEDGKNTCVSELLPSEYAKKKLFPVGRLDKDTTGFLIMTDDGEFAHKVISPKSEIEKVYSVTLDGDVGEEVVKEFAKGVVLADKTECMPAVLSVNSKKTTCATVVIREGKYHQIKRMFGVFGLGVNELKRESIGAVSLDKNLKVGECRKMSDTEIRQILQGHKYN